MGSAGESTRLACSGIPRAGSEEPDRYSRAGQPGGRAPYGARSPQQARSIT